MDGKYSPVCCDESCQKAQLTRQLQAQDDIDKQAELSEIEENKESFFNQDSYTKESDKKESVLVKDTQLAA